MLTPTVWNLRIIFYPRVLQWVQRINQKKFQAPIHPEDPFSVGRLCPNMVIYGQKSTFDRKVVETKFVYQKWSEWHSYNISLSQESFCSKMLSELVNWPISDIGAYCKSKLHHVDLCVITNIWEELHWAPITNKSYLLHSSRKFTFFSGDAYIYAQI